MKKIFAAFIFLQIHLELSAQNEKHSIAFCGGLSSSNISIDGHTGFKNRLGIRGGLSYGHKFTEKFMVLAELNYCQKGYRNQYSLTDPRGFDLGKTYVKYYSDYISLPLVANFYIKKSISFEAGIGITNDFLLKANIITPSDSVAGLPKNSTIDVKEDYKSYVVGATVRTAISFRIASQTDLLVEARYERSVSNFANSPVSFVHSSFLFGIGLRINLTSKNKQEG